MVQDSPPLSLGWSRAADRCVRRNEVMGTKIGVRLQLWGLGLLTVIMLVVMLALSGY